MAQTKSARARGNTSRASSSRSSNARSKGSQASRRTRSSGNSNSKVADTATKVPDKAKMPLVAGGAALAGLAGGVALAARNRSGSSVLRKPLPGGFSMPRPRNGASTVKALGSAAKEVAKAGYRVGELTAEVRKTREQIAGK